MEERKEGRDEGGRELLKKGWETSECGNTRLGGVCREGEAQETEDREGKTEYSASGKMAEGEGREPSLSQARTEARGACTARSRQPQELV